jgi:beta-glucanase (GH16 family)
MVMWQRYTGDDMKSSLLPLLAMLSASFAVAQMPHPPGAGIPQYSSQMSLYEGPPLAPISQGPPQSPPPQAAAAGFTNLVFDDEFDNPYTVSLDGTGNYNWYTTNFMDPSLSLPPYGYSIQNGYLTILTDTSGYSAGLGTASPSNATNAWQHGYFEASIAFCPTCSEGGSWPAFWSYSIEEATGQLPASSPYAELDVMEYYTQGQTSKYTTNVHQWTAGTNIQNSNNMPVLPPGTNLGNWHTYGCLWTSNQVQWYFDNQLVETVATGPGTAFTALEQEHMFLILGAGVQWPMYVDYVHVWH